MLVVRGRFNPFETDVGYVFWLSASDSGAFFPCVCAPVLKHLLLIRIRLQGLFERKGKYIEFLFLDPEDIKILSLGAIWNFGKGTGLS
jgi:hypothetical protein